jgi:carbohydrate kinase (thermoresistant glucokinase family)
MGVSGCGKSTIATLLAGRLGWPFAEGDDLHPPENVAKMHTGHPLSDDDRRPWLERIAAWIDDQISAGRSAVVTCSALKRSYRDLLRRDQVTFVYLRGERDEVSRRLATRQGHFMPATLLDSQFADLEPPGPDERALTVDIGRTPVDLADEIVTALNLPARTPPPRR